MIGRKTFEAAFSAIALAAVVMPVGVAPLHAQSAPAPLWSGAYVGAFGGYGGGSSSQRDNGFIYVPPVPAPPAPPPMMMGGEGDGDGNYGLSGAVGGGLVGYNYQFQQVVLGLEGDVAGTSIRGSSPFCGTPQHSCGTSIGTTGDLRGRLGYSFGNVLPFVAGGLAVARVNAYDNLFGARGSATQTGYSIGAGLEYRFAPALSLRAEYLHSDLGTRTLFQIVPGVNEHISTRTEVFRVGLSYYFSPVAPPPVVARY